MRLVTIVASAMAIATITSPLAAHAYVLESFYWQNGVGGLNYKWGSNLQASGTLIRSGFESALSDWNGTATKVFFTSNTGSSNTLNSYYMYDSSDYGLCNITHTGNYINDFTAMVNSGNTNISTGNVARSAAVHELGHGIGLDHTSGTSIMNSNRDRTSIFTPQQDDINGVNARY